MVAIKLHTFGTKYLIGQTTKITCNPRINNLENKLSYKRTFRWRMCWGPTQQSQLSSLRASWRVSSRQFLFQTRRGESIMGKSGGVFLFYNARSFFYFLFIKRLGLRIFPSNWPSLWRTWSASSAAGPCSRLTVPKTPLELKTYCSAQKRGW